MQCPIYTTGNEKQEIFTLSLFGKVRRQFELRKGIPADQRLIPICVSGPPKSHPPGPRGQFFTSAGEIFGRVPISADLYCAFYRDLLAHSRGGDKLNLIVTKRKLSDNVFLSFCIFVFSSLRAAGGAMLVEKLARQRFVVTSSDWQESPPSDEGQLKFANFSGQAGNLNLFSRNTCHALVA